MASDHALIEKAERAAHSALYDNKTASGWYGEPECAEVARLVAPAVLDAVADDLRAEAWVEGYVAGGCRTPFPPNPYRKEADHG